MIAIPKHVAKRLELALFFTAAWTFLGFVVWASVLFRVETWNVVDIANNVVFLMVALALFLSTKTDIKHRCGQNHTHSLINSENIKAFHRCHLMVLLFLTGTLFFVSAFVQTFLPWLATSVMVLGLTLLSLDTTRVANLIHDSVAKHTDIVVREKGATLLTLSLPLDDKVVPYLIAARTRFGQAVWKKLHRHTQEPKATQQTLVRTLLDGEIVLFKVNIPETIWQPIQVVMRARAFDNGENIVSGTAAVDFYENVVLPLTERPTFKHRLVNVNDRIIKSDLSLSDRTTAHEKMRLKKELL